MTPCSLGVPHPSLTPVGLVADSWGSLDDSAAPFGVVVEPRSDSCVGVTVVEVAGDDESDDESVVVASPSPQPAAANNTAATTARIRRLTRPGRPESCSICGLSEF